jgi:tRNA-dihydrouridine synthase C
MPALLLAPMEGVMDAPMRALQAEMGVFTFAVSEFIRVSSEVPPKRLFHRHVPELRCGGTTPNGLPVQVQLLGGDPGRMAAAAVVACMAGARAIDINFGCPAPTVNRHDGGATLLKYPKRLREIVAAIRDAVPAAIPVSAKLRLGWDSIDAIDENAEMAAEGGANWITIHGRTRVAGYAPPAHWEPIGRVRKRLNIPVVANGDIWNLEAFQRCQDVTGCQHFMLGRSALSNPRLSHQVAQALGLAISESFEEGEADHAWLPRLQRLLAWTQTYEENVPKYSIRRLKQWLRIASLHGDFTEFEAIKRVETVEELFAYLRKAMPESAI